jgi:hypothetical protein
VDLLLFFLFFCDFNYSYVTSIVICELFLFCNFVDIYDGIFNAFKAGARELSNASTLFELLYHKYPSYNVPFFTIVDYCGYQVSCIALLPLEKDNLGYALSALCYFVLNSRLCYGSSDGGKTVMKDASVDTEVEEVARYVADRDT